MTLNVQNPDQFKVVKKGDQVEVTYTEALALSVEPAPKLGSAEEKLNAADYAAVERLRDGRLLQIRALRPADRAGIRAAFERTSEESRYRRFFAPKRTFSEREIEFYLNVDFVSHVALVAVLEEGEQQVIAGGGRYIVSEPGRAEVAFAVDDPHQKLGHRHASDAPPRRHRTGSGDWRACRRSVAEQFRDACRVFERCGLAMTTRREAGVVHVTMALSRPDPGPNGGGRLIAVKKSTVDLAGGDGSLHPRPRGPESNQSRICRASRQA